MNYSVILLMSISKKPSFQTWYGIARTTLTPLPNKSSFELRNSTSKSKLLFY